MKRFEGVVVRLLEREPVLGKELVLEKEPAAKVLR